MTRFGLVDFGGGLREMDEREFVAVASAMLAKHTTHAGIAFVSTCTECAETYGPNGERWEKPEGEGGISMRD